MVKTGKQSAKAKNMLSVRQVKSNIRCTKAQINNLKGLGLGKIGKSVLIEDNSCMRGMIRKVNNLVIVGDITNE